MTDELKKDMDESINYIGELVIPQESTFEMEFKDGVYHIVYTEYLHNVSREELQQTKELLKNLYDGAKQDGDEIIIASGYTPSMQTAQIDITTKNPALYVFGVAGEYFLQSLLHFKNMKKNNFDTIKEANYLLDVLKQFIESISDTPMVFDDDISKSKGDNNGKF